MQDLKRKIIDPDGRFIRFPGIEKQAWIYSLEEDFDFEAGIDVQSVSVNRDENGYTCYWTIQTDGRIEADEDGFGAENREEIVLFAKLDAAGTFTGPFTCYRVGRTIWPHLSKDDQIRNIRAMEERLDRTSALLEQLPAEQAAYEAYLPEIKKLKDYYYSAQWLVDCYDDAHAALPMDLKRGILSQDAIYNVLCEQHEWTKKLRKTKKK